VCALAKLAIVLSAALTPWVSAVAFTATISAATPRALYLQVGTGSFTGGNYKAGGQPANNGTVNVVSATVPAAAVGNGTAQAMTTNLAGPTFPSYYDGHAFCNSPGQLYIGGFYRRTSNANAQGATLQAIVPPVLTNATGDTIPFSQIRWTSSGNGDTGAQPFPAGTFVAGGTQTIGTIARNQWAESCHTFSYANSAVVPSGTYTGRVVYQLSAP